MIAYGVIAAPVAVHTRSLQEEVDSFLRGKFHMTHIN